MSKTNSSEIYLLTRADEDESRGAFDYITKPLKVDELRERFKEFMTNLQSIVDVDEADNNGFKLEEIQFSAEISASGEFKLLGSGVSVEAGNAVTFVLKRKSG